MDIKDLLASFAEIDEMEAPDNGAPFNPEAGNEGEEAYNDFVADSNDIGVPGTEPAIEEI